MKTLTLSSFNPAVVIVLGEPDPNTPGAFKGGKVESGFQREVCPCCTLPGCYFDCDESKAEDSPESEDQALDRLKGNAALDGIEALILAHAVAGINVLTPAYTEGIETALDAVSNSD